MAEYCTTCKSILINGICSNRKCTSMNNTSREWLVDGYLLKFEKLVTFEQAKAESGEKIRRIKKNLAAKSKYEDLVETEKARNSRT